MEIVKLLVPVLLLVACAACGGGRPPASRTVEIKMNDTAFEPASLEVSRGETIRFAFHNTGSLTHDAVIGDKDAQKEHETMMAEGSMHHSGGDALTLKAGKSGDLTYTFDEAGPIEIGCHQPGHYGSGMRVVIDVV